MPGDPDYEEGSSPLKKQPAKKAQKQKPAPKKAEPKAEPNPDFDEDAEVCICSAL